MRERRRCMVGSSANKHGDRSSNNPSNSNNPPASSSSPSLNSLCLTSSSSFPHGINQSPGPRRGNQRLQVMDQFDEVSQGAAAPEEEEKNTMKKPAKTTKEHRRAGGERSRKDNSNHCKHKLVRYEELPEYMKENEFIRDYYRAEWPIKNALLSFFSWHNETLNVWTHMVGFVVFLGLTLLHLSYHVPQVAQLLRHLTRSKVPPGAVENVSCSPGNFFGEAAAFIKLPVPSSEATMVPAAVEAAARWPFFVFLGGSMFCLFCSSTCHLLCCHSHRLNLFLLRMDYVGIAVMIVASFFPPIYYIFQCSPHWQVAYLAAISAMGFVTVFTLLSPRLSKGEFRSYRARLFVGMGLSGIVPAVHAAVINWADPRRNSTLAYEAAMAASYLTGTAFYVTRVPERWRPGWFDLAGHSHQIFHVFVMAGALAHYGAAVILLRRRDEVGCSLGR